MHKRPTGIMPVVRDRVARMSIKIIYAFLIRTKVICCILVEHIISDATILRTRRYVTRPCRLVNIHTHWQQIIEFYTLCPLIITHILNIHFSVCIYLLITSFSQCRGQHKISIKFFFRGIV